MQRYIRTSFYAGRDFSSIEQMVTEARRWSAEVAGRRTPRALEGRTPSETFSAEESGALLPLPHVPFELARWSHPKVAPDAHVKVGRTFYSVPFRLIGQQIDARATTETVRLYLNGEVVKTHAYKPAGRQTDWADLPAERIGFFMRTPVWCRAQAVLIGRATDALVSELLAVNVLYRLRQAQGVITLADKHGAERLEAACGKALSVGDPSYKTVKGILLAGTEHEGVQPTLPGIPVPAFLHGPGAFGNKDGR